MHKQRKDYSLLAPGPVNLHPEVQKILSSPMIHHRTPEFDTVLKKVLEDLKKIFQTKEHVFLLSSTGTGGMEALIVNTINQGDKILSLVSGKFGERWADMAKTFGAEVHVIESALGEGINPSDVEDFLKKNPDTRAVLCQACETSTAVTNPIEEIAKFTKNTDTLFLVDGITAVGAYPIKMDEWGIDGLVAGSQKAFMLPAGMSFLSLSKKAWANVENNKTPKFYFDLRKEKKANQCGETYFSSNVMIIRALEKVLDIILSNGVDSLFAEIRKRAEFTRVFGEKLGFKIYSKSPSDSVTALLVPDNLDSQKIRLHLEQVHNITVMGGQDSLKGKILRIGHMGYISDKEMLNLISCLGLTLIHFDQRLLCQETLTTIEVHANFWIQSRNRLHKPAA